MGQDGPAPSPQHLLLPGFLSEVGGASTEVGVEDSVMLRRQEVGSILQSTVGVWQEHKAL